MRSKTLMPADMATPSELRHTIEHLEGGVNSEKPFIELMNELNELQEKYLKIAGTGHPDEDAILKKSSVLLKKTVPYLKKHGISEKELSKNSVAIGDKVLFTHIGDTLNPLLDTAEEKVIKNNALALLYTLTRIELDAAVDPILEERAEYLKQFINSFSGQIRRATRQKDATKEEINSKINSRKNEIREAILINYNNDHKLAVKKYEQEIAEYLPLIERKQNLFSNIKTLMAGGFRDDDLKAMFLWDSLDNKSKESFEFFKKNAKIIYNGLNEAMNQLRREGKENKYDTAIFLDVYAAAKENLELLEKVESTKRLLSEKENELGIYFNNGFKNDSGVSRKFAAIERYETVLKKMNDRLSKAKSEHRAIINYLEAHEL